MADPRYWPYHHDYHFHLPNQLFISSLQCLAHRGLSKSLGMERERKKRRNGTIFSNISKNANQPTHLMGLSCCTLSLHFFSLAEMWFGEDIFTNTYTYLSTYFFSSWITVSGWNSWSPSVLEAFINSSLMVSTEKCDILYKAELSNTLKRCSCKMLCSRHENPAAAIEQLGEAGRHCLNVPISSHRPSWPCLIVP